MSGALPAPDSSVLIAGFDLEHPFHEAATAALATVRRSGLLIAHTMAESLSALVRSPYATDSTVVLAFLGQFAAHPPGGLRPRDYPAALAELAESGIGGGALYDGLIALGARAAGATLVSLDRRAAATYERCGVEYELLFARDVGLPGA